MTHMSPLKGLFINTYIVLLFIWFLFVVFKKYNLPRLQQFVFVYISCERYHWDTNKIIILEYWSFILLLIFKIPFFIYLTTLKQTCLHNDWVYRGHYFLGQVIVCIKLKSCEKRSSCKYLNWRQTLVCDGVCQPNWP